MIFSLNIVTGPSSAASSTAFQFAKALLDQSHRLYRVFFYYDGAYHGSSLTISPQGTLDLVDNWRKLQIEHQLDITICIAAGLKRGILDRREANRYEKACENLCLEFQLGGLGQLVDAVVVSDRVVTFGG